ncbi:MAG: TIGR01777 family oxidoreductase [Spirochaetia bacterium]|nr:TIGR01777 family oxidoreductase [Spirochaetia bacterium]
MRKKILTIAGASGVVGRHIISYADGKNFQIRILSRAAHQNTENVEYYEWDPNNTDKELLKNTVQALDGSDYLINLAGTPLAEGRLNKKQQNKILMSRLNSTQALINAYEHCKNPPPFWGQASAVGYYGNSGEKIVTENDPPGDLFLSDVAVQWENRINGFANSHPKLKLVVARFGLVLANDAPAWQKMLKPVQMGVGGALGPGSQWFSWIDADDLAAAFFYLYETGQPGIYNFTSPDPERQIYIIKLAAKFLHRPSFIRAPEFVLRILLGKIADELLLLSCRALPDKLIQSGYRFMYPDIASEMRHLLSLGKNFDIQVRMQ